MLHSDTRHDQQTSKNIRSNEDVPNTQLITHLTTILSQGLVMVKWQLLKFRYNKTIRYRH